MKIEKITNYQNYHNTLMREAIEINLNKEVLCNENCTDTILNGTKCV